MQDGTAINTSVFHNLHLDSLFSPSVFMYLTIQKENFTEGWRYFYSFLYFFSSNWINNIKKWCGSFFEGSLYSSWTCYPPSSASWVLGLQSWATTLDSVKFLIHFSITKIFITPLSLSEVLLDLTNYISCLSPHELMGCSWLYHFYSIHCLNFLFLLSLIPNTLFWYIYIILYFYFLRQGLAM
jgi:hypothetical protein